MGTKFSKFVGYLANQVKNQMKRRAPVEIWSIEWEDMWRNITGRLDGKSLVMLGLTRRRYYHAAMEEDTWKSLLLRDLNIEAPHPVISWKNLYRLAFEKKKGYGSEMFVRDNWAPIWIAHMNIGSMRLGALVFDKPQALLVAKVSVDEDEDQNEVFDDEILEGVELEVEAGDVVSGDEVLAAGKLLNGVRITLIERIKTGIWLVDMDLCFCPLCDVPGCPGMIMTLDAREIHLFQTEAYKRGTLRYERLKFHSKRTDGFSSAILAVGSFEFSEIENVIDEIREPIPLLPTKVVTPRMISASCGIHEGEADYWFVSQVLRNHDDEVLGIRIRQMRAVHVGMEGYKEFFLM